MLRSKILLRITSRKGSLTMSVRKSAPSIQIARTLRTRSSSASCSALQRLLSGRSPTGAADS